MLVERITWIPKRGRGLQQRVVDLTKIGVAYSPLDIKYRILVPSVGPHDAVILELEFVDFSERERFWNGLVENAPESFWQEWFPATENGGNTEIWRVAE